MKADSNKEQFCKSARERYDNKTSKIVNPYKAVGFLEWLKTNWNCNAFMNKIYELSGFYSQPFKPEMITELFKGFLSTRYAIQNDQIVISKSVDEGWIVSFWKARPRFVIQFGTLDNWITDCNRAGITLHWRKEIEERTVLREVPFPLERRRDTDVVDSFPLPIAEPLVVTKEKGLVLADRATQRAAELVLPVFAFRESAGVLEEVGGVELVIAQELPKRSVQLIGPGTGDDVGGRA